MPEICESCGTTYRRNYETFSALLSTSGPLTKSEKSTNRCIIGDAILPQTGTKLTKNAVLNLALRCGATWRPREKPQHRCTTTIHPVYNSSKKILENLLTVGLFVRTNLFIPSCFWTTFTNFDTCCQRYIATCGKMLYRCTSTVPALYYCGRIFFKSLSYLYEVVRTNFSADFLAFRNFWPQFHEIVAPPSNECENYVAYLNVQSLVKKTQ